MQCIQLSLHSLFVFAVFSTSLHVYQITILDLLISLFSCLRFFCFIWNWLPRDVICFGLPLLFYYYCYFCLFFCVWLHLTCSLLSIRLDSTKGSYAKEWVKWEKQLREVLFGNTEYLNSVQVKLFSFLLVMFCNLIYSVQFSVHDVLWNQADQMIF